MILIFFFSYFSKKHCCDPFTDHLSEMTFEKSQKSLTLLHSERPKLHAILAFLSAIGLRLKL